MFIVVVLILTVVCFSVVFALICWCQTCGEFILLCYCDFLGLFYADWFSWFDCVDLIVL